MELGIFVIVALTGLAVGAGAILAYHASHPIVTPKPDWGLPFNPEIFGILTALPGTMVLLDGEDRVVRGSALAYTVGLIKGGEITNGQQLEQVAEVRRTEQISDEEYTIPVRRFFEATGAGVIGAVSVVPADAGSRGLSAVGNNILADGDNGSRVGAVGSLPEGAVRSRKDGKAPYQYWHLQVRVAPLQDSLLLVLVEDRSEHYRLSATRRDFIANVSHELKTPIGAIALLAETIADNAEDAQAVQLFAGKLQKESDRLTALVQDTIALTRLQDQPVMPEPEAVSVAGAVTDACERGRVMAEAYGVQVEANIDPELCVWGREDLVITAVQNLVENAVRYSDPGGRVTIGAEKVGGTAGLGLKTAGKDGHEQAVVAISIADRGIGIAPENQARIFERFYRVDPARSRITGGTGLGLAIVKHIAADLGGRIKVWSKVGEGSTFTLELPWVQANSVSTPEDEAHNEELELSAQAALAEDAAQEVLETMRGKEW